MASSAVAAAKEAPNWKNRDDHRKQKELEEARKAGTALPETDEDGKAINPHIPQYIAQAPWYLNNNQPSLKHQRQHKKEDFDKVWYTRGQKSGPAATKFRKGACTNCGAMTHNAKDCVDRPRKIGAKWTSDNIQEDEVVQQVNLDYDGKRDRWNGYDPSTYKRVIAAYDRAEVERRKKKQEASMENNITEPDENQARFPNKGKDGENKPESTLANESDSESDEDREAEEGFKEGTGYNNAPVQKVDPKTRTTIRNLRIREDTAKYLRNLDLNSAYYDPKTRSMRENPNPSAAEQLYAGDNFVRSTGDVNAFYEQQLYAWEAYEKGQEVHVQANPSQAELLYQDYQKKKEMLKTKTKEAILSKYGGAEHLESIPKELLYAQTEEYTEYSADGKLIKGVEKAIPRSKYEEDKYLNNHTQVWGSYWENGEWGFGCCKQLVKNSYCTGASGIALREAMLQEALAMEGGESEEAAKPLVELQTKALKKQREKEIKEKEEKEKREKEERFQKALKSEEKLNKTSVETDERKRGYNSLGKEGKDGYNVTEEEMEAYKLKRLRGDDPMRDYLSK